MAHPMPPATTDGTAAALAGARSLLAGIDHASRQGLDAESQVALVDAVVALGRQVEALRAVLTGEADAAKAAEAVRGTSIRSLLAISPQVTAGEAASWVHAGAEIIAHPRLAAATLAGEVSVAQARAIDTVLGELPDDLSEQQCAEAETFLLEQAHRIDAKDLAKQTCAVLKLVAPEVDAAEDELARLEAQRQRAWKRRSLVFTTDGQGSILFRGQLPLVQGEAFKRLVESHMLSNRRALERAADRRDGVGQRTFEQRTADGLVALVTERASSRRRTPAQPSVVVTFRYDDLLNRVEQAGVLASGEHISAGDVRRLACDAKIIPVVLGSASEPLDVGRDQRLVTPALRQALEARDKGCAFPGCRVPTHACEAHHIVSWFLGGDTALGNMVLMCPYHHSTVEPRRFFEREETRLRWTVHIGADGHPVFTRPPRPGTSETSDALLD
ncbi:MAG: DUF222 domain-containing protein [Propionibacteriaceae bacterium]|nr:DUF222 domain-containing protein [Propionibacteriaceae bacterium]